MKSQRAEAEGFNAGVRWAAAHLEAAADKLSTPKIKTVEYKDADGKSKSVSSVDRGNPGAAAQLRLTAAELISEGKTLADKLWPPFDPLPPASNSPAPVKETP